jgi:hypothetical protein
MPEEPVGHDCIIHPVQIWLPKCTFREFMGKWTLDGFLGIFESGVRIYTMSSQKEEEEVVLGHVSAIKEAQLEESKTLLV